MRLLLRQIMQRWNTPLMISPFAVPITQSAHRPVMFCPQLFLSKPLMVLRQIAVKPPMLELAFC
ncbi:hypothetical protein ROLI_006160 [Roseobacter fucihabitans]|uniref:Uncharacterized protein n=1 Tax=Roseobacter fucihabitans TaxID=1537242 RepID=A0ABZ2BQN6_9RHOB|nr:hypothetical protein [Roseobacter litoralis]